MHTQQTDSLGQREPRITKVDVALATLLSIAIYTVLWVLGVLVGLLLPVVLAFILVVGIYVAPRMIQSEGLRPLAIDISVSVLVGLLNKFVALAGVETTILPAISVLLGGTITGIIRRQYFPQYISRKLIKYSFSLLLVLAVLVSSSIGLYAYYFRIDIPFEYLRPPSVAKGWILTEEGSGFRSTEVKYKKVHSNLTISARRFPEAPKTKEEYKHEAEAGMQAIKPTASMFGSDITVTLTEKEMSRSNGSPRYVFRYDFAHRGRGLPMGALVQYFWYCDKLKTNVRAISLIEHTPVGEYANEVEDMISSLTCP